MKEPSLYFAPGNTEVATPSEPSGLIPMPKVKTYRTKDGRVSEKIRYDIEGFTLNEIRKLLVAITVLNIDEQTAMGNPPAFAVVDGMRGKGIAFAQRRTVTSFGNRLKPQALAALSTALSAAIQASTETRTGVLSNMGNWEYRYVREGRVQSMPMAGASGIPMGPGDFIILVPRHVVNSRKQSYATAANMRVAGSGKLSFRRSKKGNVARKNQSIGFLALAARSAQTSPMFGGFDVKVGFTTRHALPGEVVHKGGGMRTGYIRISPKLGRR